MLKSKNQVSLFVNYSYNSLYDYRSSENTYIANRLFAEICDFWFYMEAIHELQIATYASMRVVQLFLYSIEDN